MKKRGNGIPESVSTFPQLISHLIEERHDGVAWDMAAELGVSSGLVYQWRKGLIRRPSEPTLAKLAEHYDLDPVAVLTMTYRISGGSSNTPPPPIPVLTQEVLCLLIWWAYTIHGISVPRRTQFPLAA